MTTKAPVAPLQVRVVHRKQVSDGSYGTEAYEVTLEDTLNGELDDEYVAEALGMRAKRIVETLLSRSMSPRVRQSVLAGTRPPPVPSDEDPF